MIGINESVNFTVTAIPTLQPSQIGATTASNVTMISQFNMSDLIGALVVVGLFALFVGGIYVYEIKKAYEFSWRLDDANRSAIVTALTNNLDTLTKKVADNKDVQSADLAKISDAITSMQKLLDAEPTGIQGFTRGQIAMTVIFLLGTAVILVIFSLKPDSTILNNVLSMMGATLAAVVGFYFGGEKAAGK